MALAAPMVICAQQKVEPHQIMYARALMAVACQHMVIPAI